MGPGRGWSTADECGTPCAWHRVRVRSVPAGPGGGDRGASRGPQRAGGDADGFGQVALLPGPGPGEGGARGRRVAARGADAGPGDGAQARRRRGRQHQLRKRAGGERGGVEAGRIGRDPAPLHGPGAAHDRTHARGARPVAHHSLRHRRGALRLAMGSIVSARVRRSLPASRALSGSSHRRADRDRRRGDARGHRREALRGCGRAVRARLRPSEHRARGGDEARLETTVAELRCAPSGRERHRLLPVAEEDRGDGGVARRLRGARASLSRRHGNGGARRAPERLHDRAGGRHRRHHRLRHGDRQGRRALRVPHRSAGQHRSVLPGAGPGRA